VFRVCLGVSASVDSKLEILRFWASTSPPATVENHSTLACSWDSATKLIGFLDDFGRSRMTLFQGLLNKSADFLVPLSDPLTCDLGLHDWLSPEREESYSMWLQWSLQQLESFELISEAIGLQGKVSRETEAIAVDREVHLSYRDELGHGRLDLLIRQESEILCIIEVKTKPFSDEDLEKHRAYSESPDIAPEANRIFIATDAEGFDLRGFQFLSWSELCLRLRRLAPRVAARKGLLTTSLILAFVGAVEQNLLGLAHSSGKDLRAIPKTVNHLSRFLEQ
jgi:hypothetical protein